MTAAQKKKAAAEAAKHGQPTVGRTVHYYSEDTGAPMAAVVTAAGPSSICLNVMPAGRSIFHADDVKHQSEVDAAPYWVWPPTV